MAILYDRKDGLAVLDATLVPQNVSDGNQQLSLKLQVSQQACADRGSTDIV